MFSWIVFKLPTNTQVDQSYDLNLHCQYPTSKLRHNKTLMFNYTPFGAGGVAFSESCCLNQFLHRSSNFTLSSNYHAVTLFLLPFRQVDIWFVLGNNQHVIPTVKHFKMSYTYIKYNSKMLFNYVFCFYICSFILFKAHF